MYLPFRSETLTGTVTSEVLTLITSPSTASPFGSLETFVPSTTESSESVATDFDESDVPPAVVVGVLRLCLDWAEPVFDTTNITRKNRIIEVSCFIELTPISNVVRDDGTAQKRCSRPVSTFPEVTGKRNQREGSVHRGEIPLLEANGQLVGV